MPDPLFNFRLAPLEQIQPWETPKGPGLHWFGLTYGEYWIQAAETRLFEYSDKVCRRLGGLRYCDYQVARLYDDMLDLAPVVLTPIPYDLQRYIALFPSQRGALTDWQQRIYNPATDKGVLDLLFKATEWIGARYLDTGYLKPSADICFWSDDRSVHLQWDNRGKYLEGYPAWTAQYGSWTLTKDQFMAELHSFHHRLTAQMAERVAQVIAGALGPDIRIDVPGLLAEQRKRSMPLSHRLDRTLPPANWASVAAAISELEHSIGSKGG